MGFEGRPLLEMPTIFPGSSETEPILLACELAEEIVLEVVVVNLIPRLAGKTQEPSRLLALPRELGLFRCGRTGLPFHGGELDGGE